MTRFPMLDEIERRPDTANRPLYPRMHPDNRLVRMSIGAGGCWCGGSYMHEWAGQDDGAPHPRDWPGRADGYPYRDGEETS